jgi:multidrug efflux system membrane fusion protein
VAAATALAVLGAGCKPGKAAPAGGSKRPAAPVLVATVAKTDAPVDIRTFGTVAANETVAVRSQITGVLTQIHFDEGQDVARDDLLFSIDASPWEATVRQAEAVLARDTVQATNAWKEAARQEELFRKGLISQNEYDQARSAADALAASVRASGAALENARLQRQYCSIRAPIAGRTGRRMVHAGNLVKAGDAELATLNQIVPVQVLFSVPQQHWPAIRRSIAEGALTVRATIPGDSGEDETGTLFFADNHVDPGTGTLLLKARFSNDGKRLLPGQFVRVVLRLSVQRGALVVPAAAIQVGQRGRYVFVVKPDLTVEDRTVEVDRDLDGSVVVAKGLADGERVVTDGQQRLVPGARIEIKAASAGTGAGKP